MPGMHLAWFVRPADGVRLDAAFEDLKSDSTITPEVLWADSDRRAVFSGHAAYPRRQFQESGLRILLEGAIYNREASEVEACLRGLAKDVVAGIDVRDQVRRFMEKSDGEFIVAIESGPGGESLIFNDRWGRLPACYRHDDHSAAFSRTLHYLLHGLSGIRFDPLGIAEFLTMGHTLGTRTLLMSIERFPPGSLLKVRVGEGRCVATVQPLMEPRHSDRPGIVPEEAIARCASSFMASMEHRLAWCREAGWNVTADISGGRDSRAIYVALARIGARADCFSDDLAGSSECEHLPELEREFGLPIVRIPQQESPPDFDAMRRLAYATDCSVNGWTTWFIEEKIRRRLPHVASPAVRFMGLGAHVIKTLTAVPRFYRTVRGLVRDEVFFFLFSSREVSRLLGLPPGRFAAHVESCFDAMPETTLAHKLKRKYMEYEAKVVNAGEDRQRRYFWTIAPFWTPGLFAYAMEELPASMVSHRFFDRFLEQLDPRATRVPFHQRGRQAPALKQRLRYHLGMVLERWGGGWPWLMFRRKYKSWLCGEYRRARAMRALDQELLKTWAATPSAAAVFSGEEIRRIAMSRVSPAKKYQLLAVLHYMAEIGWRFPEAVPQGVGSS